DGEYARRCLAALAQATCIRSSGPVWLLQCFYCCAQAPAIQTSLRQLGQAKASRRSDTNDTYPPAPRLVHEGQTARSLSSTLATFIGRPVCGSGMVRGAAAFDVRRGASCAGVRSSNNP